VAELADFDRHGGFLGAVGIELDHLTAAEVVGHLDTTEAHHTPWGIVHGGVYATLVESAASIGASLAAPGEGGFAVGISNQTDFLRPHRRGRLEVRATAVQQGRTLQLWQVEITNAEGKLVARGQVRLYNQVPPPA
jgi:1,4-dihydroxy-2-naphthoyl-CoA hydrolase